MQEEDRYEDPVWQDGFEVGYENGADHGYTEGRDHQHEQMMREPEEYFDDFYGDEDEDIDEDDYEEYFDGDDDYQESPLARIRRGIRSIFD